LVGIQKTPNIGFFIRVVWHHHGFCDHR
jgi:hypothetical protein